MHTYACTCTCTRTCTRMYIRVHRHVRTPCAMVAVLYVQISSSDVPAAAVAMRVLRIAERKRDDLSLFPRIRLTLLATLAGKESALSPSLSLSLSLSLSQANRGRHSPNCLPPESRLRGGRGKTRIVYRCLIMLRNVLGPRARKCRPGAADYKILLYATPKSTIKLISSFKTCNNIFPPSRLGDTCRA